jgi:hypothetical protein
LAVTTMAGTKNGQGAAALRRQRSQVRILSGAPIISLKILGYFSD